MPQFRTKLVMLAKPCSILTIVLALPFAIGAMPAHAEGLFGFLKIFSAPPPPAPSSQPLQFHVNPVPEQIRPRKARRRPKPAPVEQTEVKKPVEPRRPGDMDNPVPALLADSTLQPGDMVMFPDGLRVFTGRPGSQHKLADFKPVSQAGKALPRSTHKLVAKLRPGENPAWSTAGLSSSGRLVANTKDVETTGSIRRTRR